MNINWRSLSARRAWIEIKLIWPFALSPVSLSARRAWIEISAVKGVMQQDGVALRKESVDRNSAGQPAHGLPRMSLSARRAWIEIIWMMSTAAT